MISPATIQDTEPLVGLVNGAYRGESSKRGWTTEAGLLDGIRTDAAAMSELISKPGSVILKYTDGSGRLLGCVYLNHQHTQMYLGMLTVNPEAQSKGIGRQLLIAAEEHARLQGCTSLYMTVISVRHELIAWYERHGYEQTGETRPFPSDTRFGLPKQPLIFVVMKKNL